MGCMRGSRLYGIFWMSGSRLSGVVCVERRVFGWLYLRSYERIQGADFLFGRLNLRLYEWIQVDFTVVDEWDRTLQYCYSLASSIPHRERRSFSASPAGLLRRMRLHGWVRGHVAEASNQSRAYTAEYGGSSLGSCVHGWKRGTKHALYELRQMIS